MSNISITTEHPETASDPKSQHRSDFVTPEIKEDLDSTEALMAQYSLESAEKTKPQIKKDEFLAALGIERVDNNYTPAQIIETFDPENVSEFFALAFDRIDNEMVASLEKSLLREKAGEVVGEEELAVITTFKERLMGRLIEECGANSKKSTKARFCEALEPTTSDLAKIAFSRDGNVTAKAAELLVSGRIKLEGEHFVAARDTEAAKKAAEDVGMEAIDALRGELLVETISELQQMPDLLLDKSEKSLESLREKEKDAERALFYSFNNIAAGKEPLHDDFWLKDRKKLADLESMLPLYRSERNAELAKMANLKVMLLESSEKFDPLDFGKAAFLYTEAQTMFEKELAFAEENRYAIFLEKVLGEKQKAKDGILVKRHEAELNEKDRIDVAKDLKLTFMVEMSRGTGRKMEVSDEEQLRAQFYESSVYFGSLLSAVIEQKEVLKQIDVLREEHTTVDEMRRMQHLVRDLIAIDAKKDNLYIRAADEYAHLRCEYKKELLLASLDLNHEELDIAEKELEEAKYNPKGLETKIPEGTIQPLEKPIQIDMKKMAQFREERARLLAESKRVNIASKTAKTLKSFFRRSWNRHR